MPTRSLPLLQSPPSSSISSIQAAVPSLWPARSAIPPTLEDLQKAHKEVLAHPKNAQKLLIYGEMALALGRISEGTQALCKAAQLAPKQQAPFAFLARLYQDAGYTDLEMQALQHLVSLHSPDPNVYLRLVQIYLELHWLAPIPTLLSRASVLAPADPRVRYLQSRYLFQVGHTMQAIQLLRKLFAQSPENEDVVVDLASYLTAADKISEAEQVIREALQNYPASARLQLLLAYTLERVANPLQAPEALSLAQSGLQTAAAQGRTDLLAEAYYRLGKAYLLLNRLQDALAAFQKSFSNNPAFEDVAFQLGHLELRFGKRGGGMQHILFYEAIKNNSINYGTARDLVKSHLSDPNAHLRMALWYMRLGTYADAVVEYKEALRLRPKDATIVRGLRDALLAMGRRTEAQQLAKFRG